MATIVSIGMRIRCQAVRGTCVSRAAAMNTLLVTAKLNGVNPQAWLTDVLDRIGQGHPVYRLDELLPWKSAVIAPDR